LYFGPGSRCCDLVTSAAYSSYLYPALQDYDLTASGYAELALRIMFFFMAAMLDNMCCARRKLTPGSRPSASGRLMCQKPIPQEQVIKIVSEGKSDLIENFTSKKAGRSAPSSNARVPRFLGIPAARPETRQGWQSHRPEGPHPPDLSRPSSSGRANRTRAASSSRPPTLLCAQARTG